ncbi:hypothetical protein FA95DRAFT_1607684 [Auriscalpium vulgare]|uniref:Uncharacterized protein n=1 Tax=Auriscalpium vulgare TaxID=40419 RepID=A0ACB8RMM9_9AGAM|nr:hypothetical protein FA95DRAFT_1607684 [Auriscalpium vulgare]
MQLNIPLEVQIIVVEWVFRSSQHGTIDYPTLCACALVCRSWTPVAQRLLFRRVPVPKPYAEYFRIPQIVIYLLRTLRTAPHLAAHVRSVICSSPVEFDPDSVDYDAAVFALCTSVDRIIFMGPVIPALVSRLPTLPVRPTSIFVSGEVSLVNRVINIWPSVRVLEVDALPWETPIHVPSAVQAISSHRSVLRWTAPAPELHDLEWRDKPPSHMDIPFSVLSQVRTLRLTGPFVPAPAVLEQLVELESLVIECLPVTASLTLPRSLRHFGYHSGIFPYERDEDMRTLMDAVRARPGLKLFTATRGSSEAVLKRFRSACREVGVEFWVYKEAACFPHPRHVDWI